MPKIIHLVFFLALSAFAFFGRADQAEKKLASVSFDSAEVKFGQLSMQVDYAQTFKQRQQGLMFVKAMCEQCGMLFKFSREQTASMWMKNTYLPLDVAFVDATGTIVDIKPMQPHDLTPVRSSKRVLYALEMNQGWFSKNGIKPGDQMSIQID